MPLNNFSFIHSNLAGSDAPYTISDLVELQNSGIKTIFALTSEMTLAEQMAPEHNLSLNIVHLPTYSVPTIDQLNIFVSKMKKIIENGEKAAVHCQFGQERTGIYLAVFLYVFEKLPISKAIEKVRTLRPTSLQSSHSIEFLQSLEGFNFQFHWGQV